MRSLAEDIRSRTDGELTRLLTARPDLTRPAPDMRDTVYQVQQHDAARTYEEARQPAQPAQVRGY